MDTVFYGLLNGKTAPHQWQLEQGAFFLVTVPGADVP